MKHVQRIHQNNKLQHYKVRRGGVEINTVLSGTASKPGACSVCGWSVSLKALEKASKWTLSQIFLQNYYFLGQEMSCFNITVHFLSNATDTCTTIIFKFVNMTFICKKCKNVDCYQSTNYVDCCC